MDSITPVSLSFVSSVGDRQRRGNLSSEERDHLLQQSRFDIVDYATRYGCPNYTPRKPQSFNVEGLNRLASRTPDEELQCCICYKSLEECISTYLKVYKLPECNHPLCSQCLVCHSIADGTANFKITYTKDNGEEVTVHTNSVSKNSVFTYVTCLFCRGPSLLANIDLHEAQKETDSFHMREKLVFFF